MGNGIAHLDLFAVFDTGNDISDFTGKNGFTGFGSEPEYPNFIGVIIHSRGDKFHVVALADGTVEYTEIGNHASEWIVKGVEDQCLQRSSGIA